MAIIGALRLAFSYEISTMSSAHPFEPTGLSSDIKRWGAELRFARIGVARIYLAQDEAHFLDWLRAGFNGSLAAYVAHFRLRTG